MTIMSYSVSRHLLVHEQPFFLFKYFFRLNAKTRQVYDLYDL